MGKNELTVMDGFQITTGYEGMDPELMEELKDELEDLDDERGISCRQIKVPSGGGKAYEVEGDDPDDPEVMKEVQGVIVFTHRMNSYWEGEFGSDDNKVPTCSSMDAKMGTNFETGEIRSCDTCQLNQYGNDGTGKACKNIRRVYLLLSGRPEIYMLSVPPTSIKDVNKQLARIMGSNKIPYTRLIVTFKLEKAKNKGGIEYSKVTVEKTGMLPDGIAKQTAAMRRELKEKYTEVAITTADYNTAKEGEDGFVDVDGNGKEETPFS